ncbi:cell adhesion molecule CEACAM1-like [Anomaloglossus baeobatrachus]|uniref:cell adhesion molecule CEACAM1-like n=1 Tax=Anomaloglossus baeobatrachus TaxID=238106 RepID=UPI003F50107B
MAGGATLLCALLLLVQAGAGLVITVQSNSSSDFLVGRNINLSISYTSSQNASVSWSKDNVLLVTWYNVIINQAPAYQGRLDITGKGSLVISNSTTNDAGNYTVRVESFADTTGTMMFPVKIYDPVTNASVSQSPSSADESTTIVNLSCSAASGGVTYTWTKEGKSLPGNSSYVILDGGRTLQINAPNRTHNGNYTCNVSNPVDWEIATRTLNISYSDRPSSLSAGAIAGIVIGSVAGAILLIGLIILVIFCIRKRRKGKKEKNPGNLHKNALRTISGTTLSPDDPAYFTMNNIMYRNSSISMGSYIMNSGDNTSEYLRNPSPNPPPSEPKVKHATQV